METVIKELEAKRGSAVFGSVIYILFCVGALALLFLRRMGPGLVLLGVGCLYYFLLVRRDIKKFTGLFLRENLRAGLGKHLTGVAYQGYAGIPREELFAAKLLPMTEDSSCLSFHRVTGEGKGVRLELSDVTFQLWQPEEKARARFISGCWVAAQLDHGTGCRVRLAGRGLFPERIGEEYYSGLGLGAVTWGSRRVDEAFCSFGEGGLSESVLGRVMDLVEYTPGAVAVGVEDDRVWFYLGGRLLAGGEPGLKEAVTPEMLAADPLPEMAYIMKVVTALRRME